MFPAKILQDNGRPDDESSLGIALNIFNEKKGNQKFRKIKDWLKSEPYFEQINVQVVRETDHTVTLFSGKTLRKPISR